MAMAAFAPLVSRVPLFVAGAVLLSRVSAVQVGILANLSAPPMIWTYEQPKIGDGAGRPLYQFNTVELPKDRSGRHCITVRMDKYTHALTVDEKIPDNNAVAWACYHDSIDKLGAASMDLSTTDDLDVPLAVRAYGTGVVEGLLTAKRICEFHDNVYSLLRIDAGDATSLGIVEHVVRMALVAWEEFSGGDAQEEPVDDLPKQAWAALLQMRGIRDGSNFFVTSDDPEAQGLRTLSAYDLMLVNMHAELPALIDLYTRTGTPKGTGYIETDRAKRVLSQIASRRFRQQHGSNSISRRAGSRSWPRWSAHEAHGSAIVRRVGSLSTPEDLLVGHVGFGDYGEMTRIMKVYRLNFNTLVKGVSMSSYAGCVGSTDDYLVTHRGLVAMSTTLFVPETGVYSQPPKSNDGLPAFLRALMASRLATQPRMWSRVYGYTAGLAGAKQWLIVDYSKFKAGQKIANDTVWLVESLPRTQYGNDVTHVLQEHGYIEAHGVAHFKRTRAIYGESEVPPSSYDEHVASSLVDKGNTIRNLATMRQVLSESKSSRGESQIAIAPRHDLDATDAIPAGALDAKATNRCLVRKYAFQMRSGPPLSESNQPFSFMDNGIPSFPGWPSKGLPSSWNFSWSNILPDQDPQPLDPKDEECNPETTSVTRRLD